MWKSLRTCNKFLSSSNLWLLGCYKLCRNRWIRTRVYWHGFQKETVEQQNVKLRHLWILGCQLSQHSIQNEQKQDQFIGARLKWPTHRLSIFPSKFVEHGYLLTRSRARRCFWKERKKNKTTSVYRLRLHGKVHQRLRPCCGLHLSHTRT